MEDQSLIRGKHITKDQKLRMIELMEADEDLANDRFSGSDCKTIMKNSWTTIAEILNSMGGACKTGDKWRKAWIDMKKYARSQWTVIKEYDNRTGLGLSTTSRRPGPLSALEQRILDVASEVSVAGSSVTQELGIGIEQHITETINNVSTPSPVTTPEPNEMDRTSNSAQTVRRARRIRGSAYTRDKLLEEANKIEKSKVEALNRIAAAMEERNKLKSQQLTHNPENVTYTSPQYEDVEFLE